MRHDAFISYAHEDQQAVEWLHEILQNFWVPWRSRRRIFLDSHSLTAEGGLQPRIELALSTARYLIVCCSKDSAQSAWVELELAHFLRTHQKPAVLACLVGSGREQCIPAALTEFERGRALLFKPDLRGDVAQLRGAAATKARNEALALLAPLVGLQTRERLIGQRHRWESVGTLVLATGVAASAAVSIWMRSASHQVGLAIAGATTSVQGADESAVARLSAALIRSESEADERALVQALTKPRLEAASHSAAARALASAGRMAESKQAVARALNAATSVAYPYTRSEAMLDVVHAAGVAHAAQEATIAAGKVDFRSMQYAPLAAVIDQLRLAGAAAEAVALGESQTEQALAELNGLVDPKERLQLLRAIAAALAAGGAIERAVAECGRIEVPFYRGECHSAIVSRLTSAGRIDEATSLAEAVFTSARSVTSASFRAELLVHLATALPKVGLKAAMAAAAALEDPLHRLQIAARLELLGARIDSHWGEEAVNELFSSGQPEVIMRNALEVARSLQELGLSVLAKSVVDRTLALVRTADPELHVKALLQFADPAVLTRRPHTRILLLGEAAATIEHVVSDVERSRLCAQLASTFARERRLRLARMTADQCSMAEDRLSGYTSVVEAGAKT